MSFTIQLFVYDLSNGMARSLGRQLTGMDIEGIWHTSLVIQNKEIYFGSNDSGISISKPGSTHHGQPLKKLNMGQTDLDESTVLAIVDGMRENWRAQDYHLFDKNCNNFSNELLNLLNGKSIPADILNLVSDLMSTPFGQSMRPMVDQMFRGSNRPSAQNAIDQIEERTFSNPPTSTTSTPPELSHPHSSLSLPIIKKLSRSLAPITFTTIPPLLALQRKIISSFDDLIMVDSSIDLVETKSTLIDVILPFLYQNEKESSIPEGLLEQFVAATEITLSKVPVSEVFPILDLWRIGLLKGRSELGSSLMYDINDSNQTSSPRSLTLTIIKLLSNTLSLPSLATYILKTPILKEKFTNFITSTLLNSKDLAIKSGAAALLWSITARNFGLRLTIGIGGGGENFDEEWEVELGSALVEMLSREINSEVVYRISATLAILIYLSPALEGLKSLLDVLDLKSILEVKINGDDSTKEVKDLLKETLILIQ